MAAIDISDRLITPVSNQLPMPGVEINANVADMALSGRMLSQIGNVGQLTLVRLDERRSRSGSWCDIPECAGFWFSSACWQASIWRHISCLRIFIACLSYGPLLVAGVLAAPIAQLENLLIVDREVTLRLQQLRNAISPHYGQLKPAQPGSDLRQMACL